MLALALIHVQLDRLAVGAMEGFVLVEHGLDGVLTGRYILQAANRIAPGCRIHLRGLTRLPSIHGKAEDHLRARCIVDLVARFVAGIGGKHQQQAAIERLCADFHGKADGKRLGGGNHGKQQTGKGKDSALHVRYYKTRGRC